MKLPALFLRRADVVVMSPHEESLLMFFKHVREQYSNVTRVRSSPAMLDARWFLLHS